MKQFLNRIISFFPWLGLLLLALGALSYLVSRRFDLVTNLMLGGGAVLLLLYAVLRPDEVRRLFGRRQTRYGITTLLSVILFGAILVLIYWIAFQNPEWRYDSTEEGVFTPLPETVELLENLAEPVHIVGFYPPSLAPQKEAAEVILRNLEAVSDRISYEFQDPESNPLLAEQYDLNFVGTLVFIRNQDEPDEIFSKANSLSDSDIHSALVQVVNPVEKKAYFLTGHGERDINGFDQEGSGMGIVTDLLKDQGFEVADLDLFTDGAVPEDATVVALIGQQAPLNPAETEALSSYVENGGAFFLARDPLDSEGRALAEDDGVANLVETACGITLRNDAIIDQDFAQAGQVFGLTFVGDSYGNHPIVTSELRLQRTLFDLARSIDAGADGPTANTELILTSSSSWGETRFDMLSEGVAGPDGEDALGPLAVGVSCENLDSGNRLVVIGDSDFVSNALLTEGNILLFSNAMNWLTSDELAIELTPRPAVDRQVNITQSQLTLLQITSICLGPLIVGGIGLVVLVSRRRRG